MRLHHIALRVADLERAADFYREVVELEWDCHQLDEQGRMRAVWFKLGEAGETILMLEKGGVSANPTGVLAFAMDVSERQNWRQKLQKRRITITKETPYSLYFEDPDHHQLALSHYPVPS